MMLIVAAAQTLMVALAFAQAAPPPVEAPRTTVALVETYADGRTTYELTSARPGKMWTPNFPRVKGYRTPEGSHAPS